MIVVYLVTAGFGAIVCEVNYSRLKHIDYYKGKEVKVIVDDKEYVWDGESVSYDYENFTYIDPAEQPNTKIMVDGEQRKMGLYTGTKQNKIYLETYGGDVGIFLELSSR